eukprot:CAMPEP_0202690104 /NCGR_PEP_ID=MMETSP1385-20130828/5210_1 /ASSEMBLY_ACC=CAM_ASM_000861 /TAXON_ID=933848 /ORGANISM="Elphidium margaritaceum" /LENGTH=290 /DNA_ID=CAMNT_0049345333 /DNA_START=188 /DNA_END=1060 /DNA_ORIENTATION=+
MDRDRLSLPLGTGKSKWTPLMFAIHKKRHHMVRKLLSLGANANCIDHSTKKTGFHTACNNGYGYIAKLLVGSGQININDAANTEGETPLHSAVKRNHIFCVELLLNHALHGQVCDVNAKLNTNGQTALFIACDKGDAAIVKLLLSYERMQCDVNAVEYKGYTPLQKAVSKGHYEIVKLLLQQSSLNLSVTNNLSQCAAMSAVITSHLNIVTMLLKDERNRDALYRKDYRGRDILQLATRHHIDKKIMQFVRSLLCEDLAQVIQTLNHNPTHSGIPYLPPGVVQIICGITY